MATKKKALQAAAGAAAGGEALAIEDVFSTYLYTGTGTYKTITNGIDLAGEGGMVWIKQRSVNRPPVIFDTERGATNYLPTDSTTGELTNAFTLINFYSDGFRVRTNNLVNTLDGTYASWTFRKAPRFFDVVTFSTTYNTVPSTLTHTLDAPLGMAIFKRTDGTGSWVVWHKDLGTKTYLRLNDTSSAISDPTYAPTYDEASKTFTFYYPMANADDRIIVGNAETSNWVGYFFAHDPLGPSGDGSDGLIACGSYTGNGSTNGPEINLGWEPQWVMVKRTDDVDAWNMYDVMRGWQNGTNDSRLRPDTPDAESSNAFTFGHPTATGFKIDGVSGAYNASGGTYIYIAIRRGPMRQPTSGTEVFDVVQQAGGGFVNTGNVVDMLMETYNPSSYNYMAAIPRLTGRYMETASTAAEAGVSYHLFDYNNGVEDNYIGSGSAALYYAFKRAPGFFDVVAYTGDGLSTSTFNHNLGVTPELMIIKNRGDIRAWIVYHKDLGATYPAELNTSAAAYQSGQYFPADPTETVFRPGSASATNRSGYSHIAYLFATLPGVSKVGSYTGNGSSQTINCGFTSGARFILIKRTDSTGDWYVWDTARGIVAANDPHLSLNTAAAEVTTDDSVDPDSSGFIVNQVAATNINVSSASYIYLVIA